MTKRPRRNHAAGFKAKDFLGELKPDEDVIDALEDCSNRQAVYTRIHHIEIENGFPKPPKVLNYKEYHIFKR